MLKKIVRTILRDAHQLPGWKIDRKIVVFESDDWGSIRMPSANVYEKFVQRGLPVAKSEYNRLDTLETNADLENLYDLLLSFKDINGQCPVFTANTIVANPDFDLIAAADFQQYFYEPFTRTLAQSDERYRVFELYADGIKQHLFYPQFHGREHLNIHRWMKRLQARDEKTHFAFSNRSTYSGEADYNFMEAFDFDSPTELAFQKEVLTDGLNLFEDLFGYRSKSFIPPCYVWDSEIEPALMAGGVNYIQGSRYQYRPTGVNEKYRRKSHYMGQRNSSGQWYLIRNCVFEPALFPKSDWVDYSLSAIASAFRWGKPAIISTHRINYMGSLDEKNRANTLNLLNQLLSRIITKWPDVEFMTSVELGDLMSNRAI